MKTRFILVLVALFMISNVFSQTNLNKYKYVIVPAKYDFLKEKNQYQLNLLTKFLFEKYGFEALMEGDTYPKDLIQNRCLALKSDLLKDSGLFKTKLAIELKDCNDLVVFTSKLGESREKEYARAYNEALRDAFKDIEVLNYKYTSAPSTMTQGASAVVEAGDNAEEIKKLKEEIKALKENKASVAETVPVKKAAPVAEILDVETPEVKVPKEETPLENKNSIEAGVKEVIASILYAQEIENGYQLVDSTPKVVYKIRKTGQANVFLVDGENAIIYKKGDAWVYEYNTNDGLKQKELNIKF